MALVKPKRSIRMEKIKEQRQVAMHVSIRVVRRGQRPRGAQNLIRQ